MSLPQYPASNANLPALPRGCPSRYALSWLTLTLYCLQTWVRLRVYSWVDSNRIDLRLSHELIQINIFGRCLSQKLNRSNSCEIHLSSELIWFISRAATWVVSWKKEKWPPFGWTWLRKCQLSTNKVKPISSIHISRSWIIRGFRIDVFCLSHELN